MKHMLNIAICEEDLIDAERLQEQLSLSMAARLATANIHLFPNGEALLQGFVSGGYDIIFLDIWFHGNAGMTGMETARAVRAQDPHCAIIFITASAEFAVESYAVHALHYIIKPITSEAMEDVLDRCGKYMSELISEAITVTIDRKSRSILLKDILYVEVNDKYCLIHTNAEVITPRISIDHLTAMLPSPPFCRCHRSFIVNFHHVKCVNRDFVMKNEDIVCIRQTDLKHIREQYFAYLTKVTQRL